jgi:hypothetical protein
MNIRIIKNRFLFEYNFKSICISALTTFILLCPAPSFSQSIGTLNAQLQQAVDSRSWSQAIQIIDRMIVLDPTQANRLNAYRIKLIKLSVEIKKPLFSPSTPRRLYRKQQKEYSFSFSDVGLVSDSYGSAGKLYYLAGYFNNKLGGDIRAITIYYDLLHYFKEQDSSGSIILNGIPAGKSQKFEDQLPEGTPPTVDAVLIKRIEWLDEDGNFRVDDTPRRIEPYSSTPKIRKAS